MESLEARLGATLRKADAIGDAGFTDAVMRTLPRRQKLASVNARRATLMGAAVLGGASTALLGPPLDDALSWLARGDSSLTLLVGAAFLTALGAACMWVFWSD